LLCMKRTFILLLLFIAGMTRIQAMTEQELRDSIVCFAADYLGTPYVYAGVTDKGFDCTGFVYFVYNHFGIKTSRASSGYESAGTFVEIDSCQSGDIILFTGTDSEIRKVGHAGIIYQAINGHVYFIHSSSSKNHFGVTITHFNNSPGYQKRFLRVIDIL